MEWTRRRYARQAKLVVELGNQVEKGLTRRRGDRGELLFGAEILSSRAKFQPFALQRAQRTGERACPATHARTGQRSEVRGLSHDEIIGPWNKLVGMILDVRIDSVHPRLDRVIPSID